ncbi:hypothetical protein [Rhodopila sp.]|jgi:hypothetical protein|uniref:hypothetical protein n=1 Tax=Rhodopila sp. TaxID=2480087 RepID=UPI002BE398EF|nr:hypothetical protein [Rhodopila sp.]HVZ06793.1 hypothetical protein [Rhodopila sp.]
MLGRLIDSLDDPAVTARVMAALEDTSIPRRVAEAAEASGRSPADTLAATVRGFLDTASDDYFVQLIGIMNRAPDPSLAAMRAILEKALPHATVAGPKEA